MLRILVAAGLLAGTVSVPASAQQREAWQAPTLSITRYDEDWSDLADTEKRAQHWTGPLKHIPLGDDRWITTGIELRARSENYQNNLWGAADAPDDSYLWLRVLPYADLHVGKVRVFVQPILAYAVGLSPAAGPIDQTRADLLQGFGEVDLGPVSLRAGRQMLSLGTERLVGTRYGPNVPLAFDGARADIAIGRAKISLLNMQPVQPGPGSFDDATSKTKALWGAYATLPELDLYYLGYRNRLARFGGLTKREVRHSVGLRSHGVRGDWHWNVEGVAQFGRFEEQRIAAWTLGTEVGRSFPTALFAPDVTLRVNVVSGDGKGGDGKLGTFNALFPKGKYFGELSPVGPANIVSVNPRVSGALGAGISFSLAAMAYWRYSIADGVYDIPGNLIREASGSKARFIGKEAEATIAWQATPEWELSGSLSVFSPGAFIHETGPAKTITMLGWESNFRF
ncbi:MAG: alginate export family protein [Sphingobium sp.]|uniref:alginate export family protein n=1 Tax=Sphingobium sp. TaxID=1912891 RepID=UPI0029A05DC6|nr:alginate export family protein [Sphingobium sp.]MDX3909625.1 alginate export family protein [Sphingobium sp.]